MKPKHLFYATIVAMFFTACNNDDDINLPVSSSAYVTISVVNPATKSFDDEPNTSSDTEEKEASSRLYLNDAKVYIFDADGNKLTETELTITSSSADYDVVQIIETKNLAKSVYIVGNMGSSYPDDINSLATLQSKTTTLVELEQSKGGEIDYNRLIVAGNAVIGDFTPNESNDNKLEAAVTLSLEALAVKLNVTVIDAQTYDGVSDNNYEIKDISVLYSAYETHLAEQNGIVVNGVKYAKALPNSFPSVEVGTSVNKGLYYASGLVDPWNSYTEDVKTAYYTTKEFAGLKKVWADENIAAVGAKAMQETFYAYAGALNPDGKNPKPLIVTVRTQRGAGDSLSERFFSVILDGENDLSTLTNKYASNGNRYHITITLNGHASSGGGGSDDPEKPLEDVSANFTVEQALWEVVPVPEREYN